MVMMISISSPMGSPHTAVNLQKEKVYEPIPIDGTLEVSGPVVLACSNMGHFA